MPVVGSRISVAVEPPNAFIKITGRAAVEGSRDFKALVLQLAGKGITHFILDLRDCLLMDSTFSGVLAGLVVFSPTDDSSVGKIRFTLVQPNERVADLLDNLGVLSLVQRLDSVETPAPAAHTASQELQPGEHSKTELAECCLEAHRILMALKPENVAKFRAVEQVLATKLGAR